MTAVTWWTSWPRVAADPGLLALDTCMSNMTLTRPTAPTVARRVLRTVGSYTGTRSGTGSYTGTPAIVGSYTGTHTQAFGSYVSSQR